MTDPSAELDALRELIAALRDGRLTHEQADRLNDALATEPSAREVFARYALLQATLELEMGAACPPAVASTAAPSAPASPGLSFLGSAVYGAVGQLSHGWPLAYLIALAMCGLGMLVGSLISVSGPAEVAMDHRRPADVRRSHPELVFVGRISGMIDCQWADPSTMAFNGADVPLGRKYALASGLLEITYLSGAQVVLQGPAHYEVESVDGGYLSVGKLTAKVESKEEGRTRNEERPDSRSSFLIPHSYFAVRTPTATVTDLGTEFGVEVDGQGNTTSHVFVGSVRVQTIPGDGAMGDTRILRENQSARVEQRDGGRQIAAVAASAPSRFVRKLPRQTIATLDLVDVVAGGDGFSGKRNAGIDPTNGRTTDTPPQLDQDFNFVGDGQYHRVDGLPFVDGVFIPNGQSGPVQTDSAGHAFSGFAATANRTGGHVWAGGVVPTSVDHPREIRTRLGNVDYASAGHGLLFLHADKGITFDLDAIRQANPDATLLRFRAVAGNTETVSAQGVPVFADIWVLVDGQARFQRRDISSSNGEFAIAVPLHESDRFLTLVATDGGNDIGNDWILFGDPRLELMTESEAH